MVVQLPTVRLCCAKEPSLSSFRSLPSPGDYQHGPVRHAFHMSALRWAWLRYHDPLCHVSGLRPNQAEEDRDGPCSSWSVRGLDPEEKSSSCLGVGLGWGTGRADGAFQEEERRLLGRWGTWSFGARLGALCASVMQSRHLSCQTHSYPKWEGVAGFRGWSAEKSRAPPSQAEGLGSVG